MHEQATLDSSHQRLGRSAVVAFHAQIVEQKYADGARLLPAFLDVGRSGFDLFFVISGFVVIMATRGQFGQAGATARFLWGRLTRVYPRRVAALKDLRNQPGDLVVFVST